MTNIDLTEAVEAAAYTLDPDVFDAADIVPGIRSARADACEDAHRAIRAALPHILEALAVALETDAQIAPDNAPDFHERYLAEKNIPKVRAFTALIRAKAEEARA